MSNRLSPVRRALLYALIGLLSSAFVALCYLYMLGPGGRLIFPYMLLAIAGITLTCGLWGLAQR